MRVYTLDSTLCGRRALTLPRWGYAWAYDTGEGVFSGGRTFLIDHPMTIGEIKHRITVKSGSGGQEALDDVRARARR
jgi:hypothetical protein